jgi:hypothetical protein
MVTIGIVLRRVVTASPSNKGKELLGQSLNYAGRHSQGQPDVNTVSHLRCNLVLPLFQSWAILSAGFIPRLLDNRVAACAVSSTFIVNLWPGRKRSMHIYRKSGARCPLIPN